VLGAIPVNEVTPALVAEALRPIWRKTPETARRTLQRVGSVPKLATAKGLYHRPDPVPPARLILGHQGDEKGHFAALDYDRVPAFVAGLGRLESPSTRALLFAILTASRTRPVLLMERSHLSPDWQTWSVPGPIIKMGKPFVVPLGPVASRIARKA
jgi:hypothetical protein